MDKLIINAAITGMVPTRADNPHLPVTPEQIGEDVRRCVDAGASIVHLHARDEDGAPTWRPDIYCAILERARAAAGEVVLCVSTSGRVHRRFEERSAVLSLDAPAPEMASLTLGSMNFAREESVNSPDMIRDLALRMKERGILPELEVFDLGQAEYSHYLVRRGMLQPPFYFNILLGSLGTLSAGAMNLALAVRALPENALWAATGIGRFQFEVQCQALAMGGHIRVGLEDNLWLDPERRVPATNLQLIERVVRVARAMGREIASPAEARALIGLPQRAANRPVAEAS